MDEYMGVTVKRQGQRSSATGDVDPVRSRNMSAIRGKDTKPEMVVRKELHRLGFRFRLHDRSLPGHPDLKLTKHRAVVFVHGCYWHRHSGCRYATTPATNREFWLDKLERNVERDREYMRELSDLGWRVAIVWECALRPRNRAITDPVEVLSKWLQGNRSVLMMPEVPPDPA